VKYLTRCRKIEEIKIIKKNRTYLAAYMMISDKRNIPNALTVDVEDYYHVAALSSKIHRDSWYTQESRVVSNTQKLMEMFARHDVRSTFFVLGCVAEQHPRLVKEIFTNGHEIASHGYSHRLVYEQTPQEFYAETKLSKQLLEDQIGASVVGYRAASYSIVKRSLWALDILAELGFQYDSSIFPVHHDRYGIPDARREPHLFTTPNHSRIVEWPLSTARLLGQSIPVAGGGYFRIFPYWLTRWGLGSINRQEHRPFVFYLHPWEIDPGQPRFSTNWLSQFRHYKNLDKCEGRLKRLLGEFEFGTMINSLAALGLIANKSADH
jgi:polysaccharide deacetylase family protein (PEP-CTERM system associated)